MTKYRTIYCIILLSALVTCTGIRDAAAATPPAYHVTDLGTLGGTVSHGHGINASGQVTGYSIHDRRRRRGPTHFCTTARCTTWERSVEQSAMGYGINDSGQVTGSSYTTGDAAYHAFLYDGTMHDLGTLGGTYSDGFGINASGQVTGISDDDRRRAVHAFLYDGTMHDLGTLGGTYSYGTGINASGQVTGYSHDRLGDAFLWTPTTSNGASGTMHRPGNAGWNIQRWAWHQRQRSGDRRFLHDRRRRTHAFLYDGTMHDLGTLGGTDSYGYGINASGQVTWLAQTTGDVSRPRLSVHERQWHGRFEFADRSALGLGL